MKEFDKGIFEWAQPIDPDALPEGATLTRRFGVVQKDTVRPIDDYRASLLNASVTQAEAVSIHGVDHIVPCALNIWHQSRARTPKPELVAKCWDLASAHKQVPLSD